MIIGSIIQGIMGNKAADAQSDASAYAADKSAEVTREALDLQRELFDESVALVTPAIETGDAARTDLYTATQALAQNTALPSSYIDYSAYQSSPGYEFQQEEAQKAVERSAAAKGLTLSGATLKESERYATGLASQDYWNWVNQQNNALSMQNSNYWAMINALSGLASGGQTASNTAATSYSNAASAEGNAATTLSNIYTTDAANQGNAAAAGASSWGNAASNATNNVLSGLGTAYGLGWF